MRRSRWQAMRDVVEGQTPLRCREECSRRSSRVGGAEGVATADVDEGEVGDEAEAEEDVAWTLCRRRRGGCGRSARRQQQRVA